MRSGAGRILAFVEDGLRVVAQLAEDLALLEFGEDGLVRPLRVRDRAERHGRRINVVDFEERPLAGPADGRGGGAAFRARGSENPQAESAHESDSLPCVNAVVLAAVESHAGIVTMPSDAAPNLAWRFNPSTPPLDPEVGRQLA